MTPTTNLLNTNCFIGGINRFKGYLIHVNGFHQDNYIALTKGNNITVLEDAYTEQLLQIGKKHRLRVEMLDDTVRFYINQNKVIEYKDPDFLTGSDHQYFGLEIAENSALIDNLVIFNRPLPLRITPLEIGHSYFSDSNYLKASQIYDDIIKSYPDFVAGRLVDHDHSRRRDQRGRRRVQRVRRCTSGLARPAPAGQPLTPPLYRLQEEGPRLRPFFLPKRRPRFQRPRTSKRARRLLTSTPSGEAPFMFLMFKISN
jgi:hypothetical protein